MKVAEKKKVNKAVGVVVDPTYFNEIPWLTSWRPSRALVTWWWMRNITAGPGFCAGERPGLVRHPL